MGMRNHLFALAGALLSLSAASADAQRASIWDDGFEDGTIGEYHSEVQGSAQVQGGGAREGSKYVAITRKVGGFRSELGTTAFHSKPGEYYYGFSIRIPNDFDAFKSFYIIAQWHNPPDSGDKWHKPSMFFKLDPGYKLSAAIYYDSRKITPEQEWGGRRSVELGTMQEGVWHDFVVHAKWDWSSAGRLRFWRATAGSPLKLIAESDGPNSYNDERTWFKFGIYGENRTQATTLHYDAIRIGRSFDEVAPQGSGSVPPAPSPTPMPTGTAEPARGDVVCNENTPTNTALAFRAVDGKSGRHVKSLDDGTVLSLQPSKRVNIQAVMPVGAPAPAKVHLCLSDGTARTEVNAPYTVFDENDGGSLLPVGLHTVRAIAMDGAGQPLAGGKVTFRVAHGIITFSLRDGAKGRLLRRLRADSVIPERVVAPGINITAELPSTIRGVTRVELKADQAARLEVNAPYTAYNDDGKGVALALGRHTVEAIAYDSSNQPAAAGTVSFVVEKTARLRMRRTRRESS
jgi:hypothetical protein